MPDRSRRARRIPPSTWDHILSHPVEIAIAAWWVILGALLLTAHFADHEVSDSLGHLPPPLVAWLAAAVGLGGAGAIVGVCWPGERLDIAWKVERAALIVAGGGWGTYAVIATLLGTSAVTVTMAASMVLAVILRLIAISDIRAQTKADIAEARKLA